MGRSSIINAIVKGAGIAAVGAIVSKLLTYVYRLAVARYIGPEAYGQLTLALTFLSITGTLSLLSVNQSIVKYVSEYRANDDWASIKGAVLSSLHLIMPTSVINILVMYFTAGFVARNIFKNSSPEFIFIIQILAFVAPFSNTSSVFIDTIKAFKKMRYVVFTNRIFQNLVQLVVTLILVSLGYGLIGAAWGWLAGVALSSLLAFYFMERKIGPIIFRDVKPNYQRRKILRFSTPLLFSALMATILGWIDTIILGYYLSESLVGIYNAAFPTAMLVLIPYSALNTLALPSLSEVHETGETSLSTIVKTIARWAVIASFPLFILMALFSEQVLHLLFGKQYIPAATALIILSAANITSAMIGPLSDLLKSVERTDILFKNSVVALVLNTSFNIFFIPEWGLGLGIEGAALATFLTTILMNVVIVAEAYYFESVTPFHVDIWKPVLAAIVPLVLVYAGLKMLFTTVPLWVLFPAGIVFAALYLATFVLLGGINERDIEIIEGVGEKINRKEEAERLARILKR